MEKRIPSLNNFILERKRGEDLALKDLKPGMKIKAEKHAGFYQDAQIISIKGNMIYWEAADGDTGNTKYGNPEISLPTYESFNSEESIFEAENLSYKGETYDASYNKNKSYDGVSYDLILKNTGTGVFLVFPRVFTYEEGWSQGTGRSERGYYLNTYGYGSRGNGAGQRSPSAPYYINQEFEYIMNCYTGKHYNKDNVKWYQNNAITFPKGTKIADIKKELKYR